MKNLQRTSAVVFALLALNSFASAEPIGLPNFTNDFASSNLSRGYFFTAPTSFAITGLRVPTDVGNEVQNLAVLRFNSAVPLYSFTTNDFETLLYVTGFSGDWYSTNIAVDSGDIIGILGTRGTSTMHNSYGTGPFTSSILGNPVVLARLGMQFNLNSTAPQDLWTENSNTSIARVEMDINGSQVPEPGTSVMLISAGLGLIGLARKRVR